MNDYPSQFPMTGYPSQFPALIATELEMTVDPIVTRCGPNSSLVATDQSGDRSFKDAEFHAALRAEELLPLAILVNALCRRALAGDLPRYGLPDVVLQWANVARTILADPGGDYPIYGDKADARTWAIRALRAQDKPLLDRAKAKAGDFAVAKLKHDLYQGTELTEDQQAWAESLARGVLSTFLIHLDHGTEVAR